MTGTSLETDRHNGSWVGPGYAGAPLGEYVKITIRNNTGPSLVPEATEATAVYPVLSEYQFNSAEQWLSGELGSNGHSAPCHSLGCNLHGDHTPSITIRTAGTFGYLNGGLR